MPEDNADIAGAPKVGRGVFRTDDQALPLLNDRPFLAVRNGSDPEALGDVATAERKIGGKPLCPPPFDRNDIAALLRLTIARPRLH
jgi:hypothetical protein